MQFHRLRWLFVGLITLPVAYFAKTWSFASSDSFELMWVCGVPVYVTLGSLGASGTLHFSSTRSRALPKFATTLLWMLYSSTLQRREVLIGPTIEIFSSSLHYRLSSAFPTMELFSICSPDILPCLSLLPKSSRRVYRRPTRLDELGCGRSVLLTEIVWPSPYSIIAGIPVAIILFFCRFSSVARSWWTSEHVIPTSFALSSSLSLFVLFCAVVFPSAFNNGLQAIYAFGLTCFASAWAEANYDP